jgi:hypothetical protein
MVREPGKSLNGRRGALLVVRYSTLLISTALAAAALSRLMPVAEAVLDAVLFAGSFVVGLRLRAAISHARGIPDKDLSWSAALLVAMGAVTLLAVIERPLRVEAFCIFSFQVLVGYVVGKATCAASGCCRAAPSFVRTVNLPMLEIAATATTIAAGAAILRSSAQAALLAMTVGHLVTRCASRYLRTARWNALLAPDIGSLIMTAAFVLTR